MSLLKQLTQAIEDSLVVNSCIAAAVTWVLWEMIITFDQEVKYIWKRKFTLYQVLYLLLRYGTPVALLFMLAVQTSLTVKYNIKFCEGYLMWLGLGVVYAVFWGEALIVLRLYALYGQSRKILAFCLLVFVGRIATSVYVIVSRTLAVTVIAPNVPMTGCISTPPGNTYLGIVSVTIGSFTACTFFFLTLYKFLRTVPRSMWRRAQATREAAPLLQLLLRDATTYLGALLLSEIVLVVHTLKYTDRQLLILGYPWVMATYVVIGTRLVLNLRAEATSGETNARPPPQIKLRTRARDHALTDIVFVEPSDIVRTGQSHAISESSSTSKSVTSRAGLVKGTPQGQV